MAVKIRPAGRGPALLFVSTHLDHTREENERLRQAARLNELFAKDHEGPVILAGDLNAVPQSKPMQNLFGLWTDAAAANPQPTISSEKPRSRIDYVLFRPQSGWRVIETRVLDEPVASDHRPLLAVLAVPEELPQDSPAE